MQALYFEQALSLGDIATRYGVTKAAPRLKFLRHGIQLRTLQEAQALKANYIRVHRNLRVFLDGLLLGDGGLALAPHRKSACYAHTDKHQSYLLWLDTRLSAFGLEIANIYPHSTKDTYRLVTRYYRGDILTLRHLWYPNGVKRIPADIEFSPSTLFNWFIGDGSYRPPQPHQECVMLCIEFDVQGRAKMASKLNHLGIPNSIYDNGIYVKSAGRPRFFQYMSLAGLVVPRCYQYKFPRRYWHGPQ